MNEKMTLKLSRSHKIVCFIVCFVIVLSSLTVSAFADEGVYNLNGLFNFRIPPSDMAGEVYSENGDGIISLSPFTATFSDGTGTYEGTVRILNVNYLQIREYSATFVHAESGSVGQLTIEATVDGQTVSYNATSVVFSNEGNVAYVSMGGSIVELEFTGMPSTMRFNGLFTTTTIDTDYFIEYFERIEEYDGNPWADILNGVATALDVNIFGTFSYLDIVSTLAGACLAIWLLKMLAGG